MLGGCEDISHQGRVKRKRAGAKVRRKKMIAKAYHERKEIPDADVALLTAIRLLGAEVHKVHDGVLEGNQGPEVLVASAYVTDKEAENWVASDKRAYIIVVGDAE